MDEMDEGANPGRSADGRSGRVYVFFAYRYN